LNLLIPDSWFLIPADKDIASKKLSIRARNRESGFHLDTAFLFSTHKKSSLPEPIVLRFAHA
jgi:hypothetical protein